MPLDASRNSLVVPLLGLLLEQPTHAYALTASLTSRYPQLRATRSTVTTLLKSMERAGTIAPRTPESVGNRPPRTGYELTAAGVAEFSRRIEDGLRDAQPASTELIVAVAYLGIRPAADVAELLDARADRLGNGRFEVPAGIPEVQMLEVDYWNAVVDAEITWLRTLAGRIRTRDIAWLERTAP
ncbi:PadR family transcriptional regulator [Actinoplanes sp. NPDC049265]|uniref:PadR family transcriptional regulator n=1 Tax=Actinoplanes sp. NPDC049265 TaxID=3363902 RepID=UPI00371795E6